MFPPEALASLPPQRWTERFALSAPEGKLANFVSKTPSGERLEGGAFTAVVTRDPVMAERKHREGELAVDLLKDVEILAPPGIDRGRCKQGRDVCPRHAGAPRSARGAARSRARRSDLPPALDPSGRARSVALPARGCGPSQARSAGPPSRA
ncbi:hypothetical protein [Sorangium sp. So ce296]|uniref:hypothetical protein n=1 Tax=Sorangium sp. So ce296 TaxID=3133296 RepID=UPI003F61728A